MEYYEAAAKWWTEQLRHVSAGHFQAGEGLPPGGDILLLYAGLQNSLRHGPEDEDALNRFEEYLAQEIKDRYERFSHVAIGVDYGPDKLFYDMAVKAGIRNMDFPIKTIMWVSPEKVSVQKGGGAPIVTIFPKD